MVRRVWEPSFRSTGVQVRTWPIPEMTAGGRGVRLLGCTCRGDPEAIKQAKADAFKAGYSNMALGSHILSAVDFVVRPPWRGAPAELPTVASPILRGRLLASLSRSGCMETVTWEIGVRTALSSVAGPSRPRRPVAQQGSP
jgi:hypothetical protein